MTIPPEIQALHRQLAAADRVWQREKARAWVWRSVPGFLGLVLVLLAADAFLQLNRPARLLSLALCALYALTMLAIGWYLGWRRRSPPERVARFLEERDPQLGSRLINALQLAGQAENSKLPELTRTLAAQAVGRYEAEIGRADLPRLARTGAARKRLEQACIALAVFAVLLMVFFPVTTVLLPRFLDPFGDHPPYAFTTVEIVDPGPTGAEVIYGGKLPVHVRWAGHEPRELFITAYPPGKDKEAVTLPMIRDGKKGFVQEIGDIRSDLVLIAHAKRNDFYSAKRNARVILTPKIDQAFLEIAPPRYTALRAEEQPFVFKATSALEGSGLRFRLRSNRPLRAGVMEIFREGHPTERIELTGTGKEVGGSLTLQDNVRLRFRVTDIDGIPSDEQPEALISVTHDLPPTVQVVAPERDTFVSIDYKLTAKFEATDDYGVKTLRIHRGLNGVYSAPQTIDIPEVQRDAAQSLPIDFATLGVLPGDRVSFFAEAIDTAPSPHLSRSPTVTLTLISEEEYNEFIRQQNDVRDLSGKYDELLQQFRALRDEQTALAKEAAALREKAKTPEEAAKLAAEFDALTARQNELNQRLNKQAERMEKFVRAKPLYDFERGLQQQLTEEAEKIRQSTQENRQALDQLAQQTSPSGGNRTITPEVLSQLQKQAEEQAARLGAGNQELTEKVERPLEDLSHLHDVVNDVNGFQQLYQAQQALAEQTRAYQDKGPLNREDQLALKELAAQQEAVREALNALPAQLREHADAAQEKFPKAAASGRALAEAIEKNRLAGLAQSATEKMLGGDGEQSALLAQRLEKDMARLFSQSRSGGQQSEQSDELDQFLKPMMSGAGARSLGQMEECRKFGLGQSPFPRMSKSPGQGQGSGYSMNSSAQPTVMGNEQLTPKGPKKSSKTSANGAQSGENAATAAATLRNDPPDVMTGLHPEDRKTGAISTESAVEEYHEVVDEYFKTITRAKK